MAAATNAAAGPPSYEDVLDRMAKLERRLSSVEETDRKIRTTATIAGGTAGLVVGGVGGAIVGIFCPPAACAVWSATKTVTVCTGVGAAAGLVGGAGVGAAVGHCLTTNSKT